jgi:N4-(beta-N-acetylglucosaminyl)-L-asparaginase
VACLEGVRTPSLVAKAVMEQTDHHLLAGHDAQRFAHAMGFKIREDLNTDKSRKLWLEWKRRMDPSHYLDPKARADAGWRAGRAMVAEGLIDPEHFYGTINCNAINAKGEIAGVTTTSGLAWKIPGRVGTRPFSAPASAWTTPRAPPPRRRGEANLFDWLVPDCRADAQWLVTADGGMTAVKRIVANTIEKRLLNSRGQPNFNVTFYSERERRTRQRRPLSPPLRPLHRERPANPGRRGAVHGQSGGLILQEARTARRNSLLPFRLAGG